MPLVKRTSIAIKQRTSKAYALFAQSETRLKQRVITTFAKKYGFVYFKTSSKAAFDLPVIRGTTTSADQVDRHFCIGSYDGYDVMFVERFGSVSPQPNEASSHRWQIMQFDLHTPVEMPLFVLASKRLPKGYFTRVYAAHREVRQLDVGASFDNARSFHNHYEIIGAPAHMPLLYLLFPPEYLASMGKHPHPFSIELRKDTLTIFTEARHTSVDSLTSMLDYGAQIARYIDNRIS